MASFEFPIDKLGLINSALSQTGDNLVNVADDGSDTWNVCSPAYERALAFVTEAHPWSWVTDMRQLQPAPNAPSDDRYNVAYNLPPDLVHLIYVRVNDLICQWDLQNGQLYIKAYGYGVNPTTGVLTAPSSLTIRGIFSTKSDLVNGTPAVVLAMQFFVMSGIYRGMHKDTAEAGRMMALGNQILKDAQARHDMQKPKVSMFNSRLRRTRAVRRPWLTTPGDWGGSSWS